VSVNPNRNLLAVSFSSCSSASLNCLALSVFLSGVQSTPARVVRCFAGDTRRRLFAWTPRQQLLRQLQELVIVAQSLHARVTVAVAMEGRKSTADSRS
jgi:hypothetical protein